MRALDDAALALQHSTMRRLLAVTGLLSVLAAVPVRAQAPASTSAAVQHAASDSAKGSVKLWPAVGLHYGSPLRFSGVIGLAMDITQATNDAAFLVVEPGQHGFELSAGYLRLLGQLGTGYSLRASVLRTDSEPWKANPNATYVGAEAQWMLVFMVGGRAGVYRRVSGTTGEHDTLATVGMSIGL